MAALARRHRTVERGGTQPVRTDRPLVVSGGGGTARKVVNAKENGVRPSDVTRLKGFKIEYCHINDEFVATIRDTDFMEAAKSIDKAIEKLGRIVKRRVRPATE